MKLALLTTDNRELDRDYASRVPCLGPAAEALTQGLAGLHGLEVRVVSCARRPMSSPEKLARNIFFHSLCVPKLGWLRTGYQGCIRAVRRKLREIQPDIVHGQGTERDCAISAVFSGFPNVVTVHGNRVALARVLKSRIGSFGWLAARLENFTLKRTAGVLCNSEYTEGLVRPRARRTWRVPNAIRESFLAAAPGLAAAPRCALLNVGMVSPRKRQVELLAVARELRRQGLAFEFQFAGDAPPGSRYAAAFLEAIKPMEQAGFARYLGRQPVAELVRIFDASAALVHVPIEEAFGLVVAEALARERKFFGTRVGGIPDITAGVPEAELFGVDDWCGLTGAIAGWIRRGFPRRGGAAPLMRARYRPEVIARRHVEIYREVLGRVA